MLLAQFWERVASQVPFEAPNQNAINRLEGPALEPAPWFQAYIEFARVFSPYVANPAGHNSLREIVGDLIDFDRLRRRCPVKLFIAATRVRSGAKRRGSDTAYSSGYASLGPSGPCRVQSSISLHPRRARQGRLRPQPAFGWRSYEPLALAFDRLQMA